ncbi:MAG: hypothetical protein ACFCA4_07255 [Cyanophyceae cyanobacterium]
MVQDRRLQWRSPPPSHRCQQLVLNFLREEEFMGEPVLCILDQLRELLHQ